MYKDPELWNQIMSLSARTGEGLDQLAIAVSDSLSRSFQDVEIETNVSNGRLMAYLAAHGEVLSRRFEGTRVFLHCRVPQKFLGKINDPDTVIELRTRSAQALSANVVNISNNAAEQFESRDDDNAMEDVA